jgi:hypothetical protein
MRAITVGPLGEQDGCGRLDGCIAAAVGLVTGGRTAGPGAEDGWKRTQKPPYPHEKSARTTKHAWSTVARPDALLPASPSPADGENVCDEMPRFPV